LSFQLIIILGSVGSSKEEASLPEMQEKYLPIATA
jgi:hypothetical protein